MNRCDGISTSRAMLQAKGKRALPHAASTTDQWKQSQSGKPTAICLNFTAHKIAAQVIIYIYVPAESGQTTVCPSMDWLTATQAMNKKRENDIFTGVWSLIWVPKPMIHPTVPRYIYSCTRLASICDASVDIWRLEQCRSSRRQRHSYGGEHHGQGGMVWEAVILGPHALLNFRGKENCLLHGEANGFIVCLESFQASISDVNFGVIIILAAAIWTPYASLQILSTVRSQGEINIHLLEKVWLYCLIFTCSP